MGVLLHSFNMTGTKGKRARTRDTFSRAFRTKGTIKLSTYMTQYRMGDIVDIAVNGAIHKGMPHRYYQGKTGRIWNVTKRAVGVEIRKQVGGKILNKRFHVRIEHIKKSTSRGAHDTRVR